MTERATTSADKRPLALVVGLHLGVRPLNGRGLHWWMKVVACEMAGPVVMVKVRSSGRAAGSTRWVQLKDCTTRSDRDSRIVRDALSQANLTDGRQPTEGATHE
jgi:hypothetical protein